MHSGEGLCIDMTTHNYRLKPLKGQQGQQTSIGKEMSRGMWCARAFCIAPKLVS